mgnify:CR=1 FL=1
MLMWTHRGFRTRVLVNHNSSYISSFNATNAGANLYRYSRTSTNLGFEYRVHPSLTLTLDISNPNGVPQKLYRGFTDRMQSTILNFTTVTVGVAGRF